MIRLRPIVPVLILALIGALTMWAFLSWKLARADDVPAPRPAMLFDAGPAPVDAGPSVSAPDPESDIGAFFRVVWQVGKTSIPAAAVFVCFGLVTVARRRWPPAREGTTGVLTATLLAGLTYAVSMLATGAPVSQALGGAVIALLTGRALATQTPALPVKVQP